MVFVLDQHQKPLMPCTEKRDRQLLERGCAVIHTMAPFTIHLKDRTADQSAFQPVRLKFDPGSKQTGMAMIVEGDQGPKVIFFGILVHKASIKARLDARRTHRRSRRYRKTRYRKPRFQNRRRKTGWLPPSLAARVNQTEHALATLRKRVPITALSIEHVKFDTQKMQNAEITGVQYQQGTLLGYEVRQYLLEKWGRQCVYCDATDVELQVEHVHPKQRGGSDRVSNLALACPACNATKNAQTLEDFLTQDLGRRQRTKQNAHTYAQHDPQKLKERKKWDAHRLTRIEAQRKTPLRDAAFMNAVRWRLYAVLKATGLPVEGGSGGRTQRQRLDRQLPIEHYYDALCVGESTPEQFTALPAFVQIWTAKGRGNHQRCRTDKYGFPIRYLSRQKNHFGFQTGDLVKAVIPRGKYTGTWSGRATVKASGQIQIATQTPTHPTTRYTYCRVLQRGDGWQYFLQPVSHP